MFIARWRTFNIIYRSFYIIQPAHAKNSHFVSLRVFLLLLYFIVGVWRTKNMTYPFIYDNKDDYVDNLDVRT